MADLDILEQLILSMEEAATRYEAAQKTNDVNYINRLRIFIFEAHQKIDQLLGGNHA